uniref:Uncharacterized protein n=1 Tax=Rhizophora mucronata TaxID=61149 RepID=A0A2P2LB38_RHIMU
MHEVQKWCRTRTSDSSCTKVQSTPIEQKSWYLKWMLGGFYKNWLHVVF